MARIIISDGITYEFVARSTYAVEGDAMARGARGEALGALVSLMFRRIYAGRPCLIKHEALPNVPAEQGNRHAWIYYEPKEDQP